MLATSGTPNGTTTWHHNSQGNGVTGASCSYTVPNDILSQLGGSWVLVAAEVQPRPHGFQLGHPVGDIVSDAPEVVKTCLLYW